MRRHPAAALLLGGGAGRRPWAAPRPRRCRDGARPGYRAGHRRVDAAGQRGLCRLPRAVHAWVARREPQGRRAFGARSRVFLRRRLARRPRPRRTRQRRSVGARGLGGAAARRFGAFCVRRVGPTSGMGGRVMVRALFRRRRGARLVRRFKVRGAAAGLRHGAKRCEWVPRGGGVSFGDVAWREPAYANRFGPRRRVQRLRPGGSAAPAEEVQWPHLLCGRGGGQLFRVSGRQRAEPSRARFDAVGEHQGAAGLEPAGGYGSGDEQGPAVAPHQVVCQLSTLVQVARGPPRLRPAARGFARRRRQRRRHRPLALGLGRGCQPAPLAGVRLLPLPRGCGRMGSDTSGASFWGTGRLSLSGPLARQRRPAHLRRRGAVDEGAVRPRR
mmetsp:Transcript_13186/g.44069  ORF Transcript_13186/g.44069 Transcript_13186/m.44069 type:complete len:385 (-) Transcript_13186:1735-2889(-)